MVITICNFKGGVGKTTTCHALATAKALQGNRVLVVDLDGQHSLTTSCGVDVKKFGVNTVTISDLIMAEIKGVDYNLEDVHETIIELKHISLIPSTKILSFCDKELTISKRADVLENILNRVRNEYDYIFLDCSPTRNSLCENALYATDSVIIPVESYYLGSEGLYDFIETVDEINSKFHKNVYIEGIILTMFQKANLCKTVKAYILDAIKGRNVKDSVKDSSGMPIRVFEETIPRSVKVSEAGLYGKSIIEYMPNNPVSKQYMKIAEQIKVV